MSMATISISPPTYAATASASTGVVIPLYWYPDSEWTAIIQARATYPNVPIIAIVNPNNGPGSSSDPNYVSGIHNMQAVGLTGISIDSTLYGNNANSIEESHNDKNNS